MERAWGPIAVNGRGIRHSRIFGEIDLRSSVGVKMYASNCIFLGSSFQPRRRLAVVQEEFCHWNATNVFFLSAARCKLLWDRTWVILPTLHLLLRWSCSQISWLPFFGFQRGFIFLVVPPGFWAWLLVVVFQFGGHGVLSMFSWWENEGSSFLSSKRLIKSDRNLSLGIEQVHRIFHHETGMRWHSDAVHL